MLGRKFDLTKISKVIQWNKLELIKTVQIVLLYGEGRLLMKSKKRIALLLILTLMLSMVPWGQPARAVNISDFVDMPSDRSTDALEKAVNNGLISGFEEYGKWTIKPSANLTRAQKAAIVNRAFGATDKASLSGVWDVSSGDWFAEDMQRAIRMGTFKQDTYMRPNDPITSPSWPGLFSLPAQTLIP